MLALLEKYPKLKRKLPHVGLGDFPTPVKKLDSLGKSILVQNLYIKNDGLSSEVYGGNKVRKLEFLLADALEKGASEILTFGFAGSNHAAATAIWARKLGMKPVSVLLPQPNAEYVRENLLAQLAVETEFVVGNNVFFSTVKEIAKRRTKSGKRPYIVAPGGSSNLGTVGYVSAGIELARQIRNGSLPVPQRVYVPLGSMGTAVGIMIGLKASGLTSKVVCVRIVDRTFVNPATLRHLFDSTRNLLRIKDPSFPNVRLDPSEIDIRHDYHGEGYARFTSKGRAAAKRMFDLESTRLDGTYTAKTLACLIDDAKNGQLEDETVLFWNTKNAAPNFANEERVDYKELPTILHGYFEQAGQRLLD